MKLLHSFILFTCLSVCLPLLSISQTARFEGNVGYKIDLDASKVEFVAEKIINNNVSRQTGALTLQLFLSDEEYSGGNIKGYLCGEHALNNGLKGGESIIYFKQSVVCTRPPNGNYYPVVLLLEKNGAENVIIDYETFEAIILKKSTSGSLSTNKL